MTESLTSAGERQLLIEQEMARLVAEHQAAAQSGGRWADTHRQDRVAGLGELDGIVTLIDNGSGE